MYDAATGRAPVLAISGQVPSTAGSGRPARKVVSISGDGGLGQYLTEITTLVKYEMDVTHVVLNNNQLGKITKEHAPRTIRRGRPPW